MGLKAVFGINGIGKDTVVDELMKKHPSINSTSMSRINMYILGITKTYDLKEKVTEEQYRLLEETPQETMIDIENNQYRKILENLSLKKEDTIFIGHLISALRLGKEVKYLTNRTIPDWFISISEKIIQLKAPAEIVAKRRSGDTSRKRMANIAEIEHHQRLCDSEWERIKKLGAQNKMYIVNNIELNKAVKELENILYPQKSLRKQFAEDLRVILNNGYNYTGISGKGLEREGEER